MSITDSLRGSDVPKPTAPVTCAGVALVEFDIDRGSVVRFELPDSLAMAPHCASVHTTQPGSPRHPDDLGAPSPWSSYLADQLIPDASEKYDFSVSWMCLNRPPPRRRRVWNVSTFASAAAVPWQCLHRIGTAAIEDGTITLVDSLCCSPPIELPVEGATHHPMPSLPTTVASSLLHVGGPAASARDADGDRTDTDTDPRQFVMIRSGESAYGVLFANATEYEGFAAILVSVQADTLVRSSEEPLDGSAGSLCMASSSLNSPGAPSSASGFDDRRRASADTDTAPIYGLACTMTKKDGSVRRGSLNKGVAIFSPQPGWLGSLVPLLEASVYACCCIKGWDGTAQAAQRAVLEQLLSHVETHVLPTLNGLADDLSKDPLEAEVRRQCAREVHLGRTTLPVDPTLFLQYVPRDEESPRTAATVLSPNRAGVPVLGVATAAVDDASMSPPGADATSAAGNRSFDGPLSPPPDETTADMEAEQSLELAATHTDLNNGMPSPQAPPSAPSAYAAASTSPFVQPSSGSAVAPTVAPLILAPPRNPLFDATLRRSVVFDLYQHIEVELLNVLLCAVAGRRVVVLSRHVVATKVSDACMAFAAVLSDFDPEVFATRVFPYTAITNTRHFEDRSDYIVGTLNPIFEQTRPKRWWDVLLDLEKRTVTYGDSEIQTLVESLTDTLAVGTKKASALLGRFHALGAMDGDTLELDLRRLFRDTLVAAVEAASIHTNVAICAPLFHGRIGAAIAQRVQRRRTDKSSWAEELSACPRTDANALVSVLQRGLRVVSTAGALHRLLLSLPVEGGLLPIAELLFHPAEAVVLLTVALLRRIDADPVGRRCITNLNSYVVFAFEQLKEELPATA